MFKRCAPYLQPGHSAWGSAQGYNVWALQVQAVTSRCQGPHSSTLEAGDSRMLHSRVAAGCCHHQPVTACSLCLLPASARKSYVPRQQLGYYRALEGPTLPKQHLMKLAQLFYNIAWLSGMALASLQMISIPVSRQVKEGRRDCVRVCQWCFSRTTDFPILSCHLTRCSTGQHTPGMCTLQEP
jgi:hypothetical protein